MQKNTKWLTPHYAVDTDVYRNAFGLQYVVRIAE